MKKATKSKILPKDSPVLRKVALAVPKKSFGSKELEIIIKKMATALHKEDDGVAIAAPQVGVSLRIFLVNGQTLGRIAAKEGEDPTHVFPDILFINPEIIKLSKKKKLLEEGCLSVRWLYGKVRRSEKATVRAFDIAGRPFTLGASGLLAQIFQHEIDHLDGILFIDKALDLEEIPPPKPKTKAKQK
ncbi:MAG: peptide deformylase [Parcubacteria group bacterium]